MMTFFGSGFVADPPIMLFCEHEKYDRVFCSTSVTDSGGMDAGVIGLGSFHTLSTDMKGRL